MARADEVERLSRDGGTTRLGVVLLVLECWKRTSGSRKPRRSRAKQAIVPARWDQQLTMEPLLRILHAVLAASCREFLRLLSECGRQYRYALWPFHHASTAPLKACFVCGNGTLKRQPSFESVHRVEAGAGVLVRPKRAALPILGNGADLERLKVRRASPGHRRTIHYLQHSIGEISSLVPAIFETCLSAI